MKRGSLLCVIIIVVIMMPMTNMSSDYVKETGDLLDESNKPHILSDGQLAYSGSGDSRTATLQGLTTNTSAGPLHIDSSSSEYGYVDVPTGWTGTNLLVDIDYTSMWETALTNADLDDYHYERLSRYRRTYWQCQCH